MKGQRIEPVRAPTCDACALDRVEFVIELELPRFTMEAGERWAVPRKRVRADGSFELGGGLVRAEHYRVICRGWSYVVGRTCGCRPIKFG